MNNTSTHQWVYHVQRGKAYHQRLWVQQLRKACWVMQVASQERMDKLPIAEGTPERG